MNSMIPQPQGFVNLGTFGGRVVRRAPALLFLLAGLFLVVSSVWASTTVTLSSTTSPTAGQAGITSVNVMGSGFPAGAIPASNVTVTLQPSGSSGPSVTAAASAVTTILGTVRRVTFQIPTSIVVSTPTAYNVSIAGTTSTGVTFLSGNASALTVNPPSQIVSLSPALALAGQTISVLLVGQYTSFAQGVTQANFGPEISVGGAPEGAFGPVTVSTPTTLAAEISIAPAAVQGARTVAVATGVQQAVLANGFTVEALVSMAVTPANTSIAAGTTQQFTATGTYSNGSTQNLTSTATWGSSAPSVATIAAGGLAKAVKTGASTITAALSSITGSTTLTVTAPVLVSMAVTPANTSIAAGTTQQFTATGTYSNGSTQNLTSTATWSSSAPGVATISTTGLASAVAAGQTTIEAALGAINGSATLNVLTVGGFTLTGSMNAPRLLHTATLLNNGLVLVAGGLNNGGVLASAELYNPATGTFTPTGSMNTARNAHTATLLNNGLVLMAGGSSDNSAELYNPTTGTFSYTTDPMNTVRDRHTATLLNNGIVLIAGGWNGSAPLASAELYNPANGTFSYTTNLNTGIQSTMNSARFVHTATLLNNGMVLIAGGETYFTGGFIASAELYNPATGTFTYTTYNMNYGRSSPTATLLNNGMVLVAGGFGGDSSAELYNPAPGTFTLTDSMNTVREQQTATLLNNSMVLVAGGFTDIASAELYDSASGSFTPIGNMNTSRALHTATLLNNGTVLVAGGDVGYNIDVLASAELYQPVTLTPPNLESIVIMPAAPTLSPGGTQQFIATGTFGDGSTQQLASVTWSSSDPSVAQISNDWSNHGVGLAIAAGTVTITATAGSVSGSATLTVQ
jgi:uncharacterized protein YjdB